MSRMGPKSGDFSWTVDADRTNPTYDFAQPDPPISDVILLVGGQRFHLNKAFLAMHSQYFRTMFFSKGEAGSKRWTKCFKEEEEEVELKEVGADEFVELLSVIHSSLKPVSEESVEFLLKLADRFEMKRVVGLCEDLLFKQAKQIPLTRKFLLADQFGLHRLHEWCLEQLRCPADVRALKRTWEYGQLSDKGKVAVMEKAAGFCDNSGFCHKCGSCYGYTSCRCYEVAGSGYLRVGDLMRMDVYNELGDGVKLALLMKALHF